MAEMSSAAINDLPDSAFAYIEPGGTKDEQGKTVPRSKRHFPIHDAAHVRNALARAPQSPYGEKAMPKIRAAAKKFGIDVSNDSSRSNTEAQLTYDRAWPLDGIEVLSRAKGGDGRTVEAYAAVFDTPTEIHDQHGDYMETIDKTSFNRTVSNGNAMRAMVLYNHGRTVIDGKPDSLAQVPLGKALEVRVDGRGLLTVSRYNKSALADAVLQSIANGDITSQSFRGGIYRSNPNRVPKVKYGQPLPTVRRMELGLTDFGPTPTAYYPDAAITAVRSAAQLAEEFAQLDEAGRTELIRMLSSTPTWDPDVAAVLATPRRGLGAEDPHHVHSARQKDIARQRQLAMWAELAEMEMAVRG